MKVIELPDGRRIRSVRLFISQPKLRDEPLEHVMSVSELLAFAERAKTAATRVEQAAVWFDNPRLPREEWDAKFLNPKPGDKECSFCRAMATCPSARAKVQRSITPLGPIDEPLPVVPIGTKDGAAEARREITRKHVPTDLDALNAAMESTYFMEDWILAVRAEVERQLLSGAEFDDFGLELGRKGNRAFRDPEAATKLLRQTFKIPMRDVFNLKLKTPAQLEELRKPTFDLAEGEIPPLLGKNRWDKLMEHVSQGDPKPSVKRKSLIKTPYVPPKPESLGAVPDEDDSDLY